MAHPKANTIFLCSRAIRESADVLVCRLVGGKVTYVHRRLWPALVRLAGRFSADQLAVIEEVHTPSGRHRVHVKTFQEWVPEEVAQAATRLNDEDATLLLRLIPTTRILDPSVNLTWDARSLSRARDTRFSWYRSHFGDTADDRVPDRYRVVACPRPKTRRRAPGTWTA